MIAQKAALSHVVVTNATLFDGKGAPDLAAIARHAEFLVDSGIRVVVPAGNTGEFGSLDIDEVKAVTSTVARAVGNRAMVLAGVGWSAKTAIELARHAQAVGVTAVMIHHPVHTYIDRIGLRRYYEQIIESIEVGVVLYKRGPELTDDLIASLATHERVVGVKYATPDLNAFARLVAGSPPHVAWLCGSAERWAPFFSLAGAHGFTSGLANFAPSVAIELFDALAMADYRRAMELRAQIAEFEDLRQEDFSAYNVPAVKEGMQLFGLGDRRVREPLRELDDERRALVRRVVQTWPIGAESVQHRAVI